MSFRAQRGISNVIPAQAGIQRDVRVGQHHGNHFNIMAIMVQSLPPSQSVRGQGDAHTSFPRRRESRGMYGRGNIMAIISKSWQSWFKTHHTSFPRRRESRGEERGKSWQSFPHHGNHGSKPPPFAQRKGARGMPSPETRQKTTTHQSHHGSKSSVIVVTQTREET